MKKTACPLAFAVIMAVTLAGCFGGEEEGATGPGDGDTSKSTRKTISPGLYAGDYTGFDPLVEWESEFTLDGDGSYRFFWFADNEVIGDFKGNWFQKDSNLHFTSTTGAFIDENGLFGAGDPLEDDTNSIRDITDSSFSRREMTLIKQAPYWVILKQKPYWITYRKKRFGEIKGGEYAYTSTYRDPFDSTDHTFKITVAFQGEEFKHSISEDSVVYSQSEARWYQIGSLIVTEQNRGRVYIDSLDTFSAWDSLPGTILQRIRRASDTAFEMWSPGNPGTWDVFRKSL